MQRPEGGVQAAHSLLETVAEADFLEAAGSLREDSDYGRKTALKSVERARAALQMEIRLSVRRRTTEAGRRTGEKRGDRGWSGRSRVASVAMALRDVRETERALGLVANRLGQRKMAVDAWEKACAGVDSSCRRN